MTHHPQDVLLVLAWLLTERIRAGRARRMLRSARWQGWVS